MVAPVAGALDFRGVSGPIDFGKSANAMPAQLSWNGLSHVRDPETKKHPDGHLSIPAPPSSTLS